MTRYYISAYDTNGVIIFEGKDWFKSFREAKRWLSDHFTFLNQYQYNFEILKCTINKAKSITEFTNRTRPFDSIIVYAAYPKIECKRLRIALSKRK